MYKKKVLKITKDEYIQLINTLGPDKLLECLEIYNSPNTMSVTCLQYKKFLESYGKKLENNIEDLL